MRAQHRSTSRLGVWSLLLLLGACSLGGPLREDQSAQGYRLQDLHPSWNAVVIPVQADRVYQNKKSGSQIVMKSVCGRYENSSLNTLIQDLVNTIGDAATPDERSELIDGRESLWKFVRGQLDGVPVEGTFVVLRKNHCIFDFSLLSKAPTAERESAEFSRWVRSFRFAGGAE